MNENSFIHQLTLYAGHEGHEGHATMWLTSIKRAVRGGAALKRGLMKFGKLNRW